MNYGQEIFWFIPQTMYSSITIQKLLAITEIMSLHMNIF
jgi:hypothetical protein